jgi:fibronectin-binding autotransporter adhesin
VFFCSVALFFIWENSPSLAQIPANTLPTGGTVTSGSAVIAQNNNTLNINQSSQKAIINWSTFDVGSAATVNFNQPNSQASTLNRVNSASKSMIDGAVNSNGTVIFVNPNGIVFGKGAQVNTGSIVATTMNITDQEYLSENNKKIFSGSAKGKIVNNGTITANNIDGYIALMAPQVKNQGVVIANMSGNNSIALVSGEKVTLTFQGEQLLNVNVDASTIKSLIKNKNLIQTNGGQVIIAANAASDLKSSVLVNTGTVSADGLNVKGGRIYLTASTIKQQGIVTASAKSNSSGTRVEGGTIVAQANTIKLKAGSQTLATGDNGGGVITLSAAKLVNVKANAVVDASANTSGNGGSINIDAPTVKVMGKLFANGGNLFGNGGSINIIANDFVTAASSVIKAGSQVTNGVAGNLSISMPNINITQVFASLISSALNTTNVILNALSEVYFTLANSASSNAAIINLLQGVVIYKTTSNRTGLQLNAEGSIYVAGQVVADEGSLLDVVLSGNNTISINELAKLVASSVTINSKQGEVDLNGASLTSAGGNINITAKGDINIVNLNVVASNPIDGGEIIIASSNGIVNLQQSFIQTNGGVGRGGTISITANQDVAVLNTNVLANGGENGGQVVIVSEGGDVNLNQALVQTNGSSGRGGTIQIAAHNNLILNATLQVNSEFSRAGTITLEANYILIESGSSIEAIGTIGGGNILVGGSWQNSNPDIRQATFVTMNSGVVINASALLNGNGGEVVLWSDITNPNSITKAFGTIYAKSGIIGGDGGRIETSGYQLYLDNILISAESVNGSNGNWLLDPRNIVISESSSSNVSGYTAIGDNAVIDVTALNNALAAGTNVEVFTGSTGNTQAGTITVSNAISAGGTGTLTLRAAGNIIINADITRSSTGGLILRSGTGSVSGTGTLYLSGATTLQVAHGNTVSNNIVIGTEGATIKLYDQLDVQVLIVAAGGTGGGNGWAGGGGGGGVIYGNTSLSASATKSIYVGSYVSGAVSGTNGRGNNGQNSSFDTVTALGGGGGAGYGWANESFTASGAAGGSGGGAGEDNNPFQMSGGAASTQSVPSGWTAYGNSGGSSLNSSGVQAGAGGGGAGSAGGSTSTFRVARNGGSGIAFDISGSSILYGGGGGGATCSGCGSTQGFGVDGGGNGGVGGAGTAGTPNRGGGGGGSQNASNAVGGSGTVIIRYAGTTSMGTGGTTNISGNNTIHTFNSTGSSSFVINQSFSATLTGIISGENSLTVNATGGTLTLNRTNTYTGNTTISGGTLVIGGSGSLNSGNYAGTISNAGTLIYSSSANQTFAGVISGVGSLIKNTTISVLTLSANNTYTGVTTISAGTLSVSTLANGGSDSGIGKSNNAATNLIFDGGTLAYTGAAVNTDRLFTITNNGGGINASGTGALNFTSTGSIVYTGTNARFFTLMGSNTGDNTLRPILANNTGATSLTKAGLGTWILSGSNTYTGLTTVNGGILELNSTRSSGIVVNNGGTLRQGASIGYGAATYHTINSGGTYDLNGVSLGLNDPYNIMTLNGGTLANTSDTAATLFQNASCSSSNQCLVFGSSGGIITPTGNITVSAVISGGGVSGRLTKTGTGTLTLSGANTYSGGTRVSAGILSISSDANLGAAPGSVTASSITLNGGALQVTTNVILNNNRGITLTANSGLASTSTNRFVYAGIITGDFGLTINGSSQTGVVALAGSNTHTGTTTVSSGSLGIYKNDTLGSSAISLAGSTTLLLGRAVTEITNNIALTGNATVAFDTNVEYLIVGGGGGGGTRHAGGGGGGGVLSGSSSGITSGIYTIVVGAGGNGAGSCYNASYVSCSAPTAGGLSEISGSGFDSLTAIGGGAGRSLNSTVNSINGGSGGGGQGTAAAGTGTPGQGFAGGAGSSGAVPANFTGGGGGGAGGPGSSGTTNLGGAGGVGFTSSISGTSANYAGGGGGSAYQGGTGGAAGSGGATPGTANANASSATANTGGGGGAAGWNNVDLNFTGGAGGSGIVIVRYLGADAAAGGTETTGSNLATGYRLHTFTSTGSSTLTFNALAVNFSGTISGGNSLTVNATGGTVTLTGTNTYSGNTTISGGTLVIGGSGSLNSGNYAGTISNAGRLIYSSSTNQTFAGVISGAGSLVKNTNTSILTLSANNTYTGATTVNAGTLALTGKIYCPTSACNTEQNPAAVITITSGATLEFTNWGWLGSFGSNNYNTTYFIIDGGTLKFSGLADSSAARGFTVTSNGATFENATSGINWGLTTSAEAIYQPAWNGPVTFTGIGNITIGHIISGANAVTKSGSGSLSFSAANTYTGLTTISGGTLAYGINNAISTGGITVNGTSAVLSLGTYTDSVGAVIVTRGSITGSGTLTSTSGFTFNPAENISVSATPILAGSVALSKSELGTATLSGANTYTGLTTISAGTLKLGATGSPGLSPLGSTAAGTVVSSTGTLDLAGFTLSTAEALTLNGTGTGSIGALMNSGAAATYSGLVTLGSTSSIIGGTGTITISNVGIITGSGLD